MKAREPDIKVKRWVAMLQAADLIEREGHYNFSTLRTPSRCIDEGCVLGWIGYCAGFYDAPLTRVAEWLGYYDSLDFYRAMICHSAKWIHDPSDAAATLRKLAEEMSA